MRLIRLEIDPRSALGAAAEAVWHGFGLGHPVCIVSIGCMFRFPWAWVAIRERRRMSHIADQAV